MGTVKKLAEKQQKKPSRGKGEGSIFKRADGLWIGRIELPPGIDGVRRRKQFSSKKKSIVIKKMREIKNQLAEAGDLSTGSLTVDKWFEIYFDDIEDLERPKTVTNKKSVHRLFISPLIGKKKLDRVSTDDVRRLQKVILSTPKDTSLREINNAELPEDTERLSTSYAINAHNTLSAALGAAVAEQRIHSNVCDLVRRPKRITRKDNALNYEQMKFLWKRLLKGLHTNQEYLMLLTYLLTGARRGEVAGLQIEYVADSAFEIAWQVQAFTKRTYIPEDVKRNHLVGVRYLTEVKSDSGNRIVPLVEPLRGPLLDHIRKLGKKTGLIFTNNEGEAYHPDTITDMWRDLMIDLELPPVTLHGARHTLIDMLYDAGVPEVVITEIVGHADRATSQSYRTRGNIEGATQALESVVHALAA